MRRTLPPLLALALSLPGTTLEAASAGGSASLRGSPAAMLEQNRMAKDHGLSFFRTPEQIRGAADRGELVALSGSETYEVADFVDLPYAVPAVRTFVERLSAQYMEACGQKLVVTSAVRASSRQPRNAHALSVHPAGMAVDLRVSDRASCRQFLEDAILALERQGVINGIREFNPPHYHIAIYPEPYLGYVEERLAENRAREEEARAAAVPTEPAGSVAVLPPAPVDAVQQGAGAPARLPSRSRALLSVSTALVVAMGGWAAFGRGRSVPGLPRRPRRREA